MSKHGEVETVAPASFLPLFSYAVFGKCHVVDDVSECEVCEWSLK
jgi:hypothetical protein